MTLEIKTSLICGWILPTVLVKKQLNMCILNKNSYTCVYLIKTVKHVYT